VSALAELERLRGAVGAQRQRVAQLEDAARESARRVQVAREQLADFYRERERGGANGGDDGERALIDALREAEGGLGVRPTVHPHGEGLLDVELHAVDPKAEAMLEGARELLADREAELRAFVIRHLSELAVERASRAGEVAERCERALRVAAEAAGEYESERSWWAGTLALTVGEGDAPNIDVPGNPFEGLRLGVTIALPMPERFTE
jgi:hypothetical protein